MLSFEPAAEAHLPALTAIYNDLITRTTVLFWDDPITVDDMRAVVHFANPRFTAYAILEDGAVAGTAALRPYKERSSYDATAELTVILAATHTGRGLGGQALAFLENAAKERGFHALLAVISAENDESVAFFRKHGYAQCGLLKEVGRKFGRLLDVAIYEKHGL